MFRMLLILIEHFKLGLLGFVIVMAILFTIYSHRVYSPQNMGTAVDTVCLEAFSAAVPC